MSPVQIWEVAPKYLSYGFLFNQPSNNIDELVFFAVDDIILVMNIEENLSIEKVEELLIMKKRIERALSNQLTRGKVLSDFTYTFKQLGLSDEEAADLCKKVYEILSSDEDLLKMESTVMNIFKSTSIKVSGKEINLIDVLHEKLKDRARIIASQVAPNLADIRGSVIDYGAGDGQVTQILHDSLGLDIEGVDIRLYKSPGVTVPISLFNGGHVDVGDLFYEAGLLTNIFHHEKDNEQIMDELDRIVSKRLVVLETVPVGVDEKEMEEDKDRTFMNDYLYNHLFHNADVPVPGAFETPKKWIERFSKHGWKLIEEKDLGFDQPTIKDRHYLLVFSK